ncbi:DUF6261 family protein [Reichenbachiella versicolor]|uniref:DUF6261 family protein n=1 Tax=Reichenbachiella versicolor TaxID=1821036 RepID=UPI000D6E2783|nr:DUF6261 family protein [Reichenbachiella versicolor]
MLDRIPYASYTLGNLVNLSEEIISLLKAVHPDELMIGGCISRVETAIEKAREAGNTGADTYLSKNISKADDLRDVCYRSLRDHIQAGMGRETNLAYQEACKRLWQVFKKNNTLLASLPYDEETIALNQLFEELKPLTNELGIIHATSWLQELIKSNQDFETVMEDHLRDQKDAEPSTDQAIKASLTDELKILVSTINSLWTFNRPKGIKKTVDDLNLTIAEFNTSV